MSSGSPDCENSVYFLIEVRNTGPGMALPTMSRFPPLIPIKKIFRGLVCSSILWKVFFFVFLLFDDYSLSQVDIKLILCIYGKAHIKLSGKHT